jgi:hypothetical protein
MSSGKGGNAQVDKARQVLCDEIARCLRNNRFTVRVRIAESDGKPVEALVASHGEHGWQKESQPITDRPLVNAINETLEMLASKAHHDAWSARRQSHSDGHDTELQFHREKLGDHPADKFASVLMGLLFRDHHDSSKDSRRNIRTPPPKQARR